MQSPETIKNDLAAAYNIFASLGLDDLTYTHLSARVPGGNTFYICHFGDLFNEITPDSLLEVTLDGEIVSGDRKSYNATGVNIHGSIYQTQPDINAVFHLHTIDGVAVASHEAGLLMCSQFAFHFYNKIGRYGYDSLVLDPADQGPDIVKSLGNNKALLMNNHGLLTVGETIPEAFFYMYYLDKACQTQNKILAGGQKPIIPANDVCERASEELRAFEPDLGRRDFTALKRKYKLA